MIALSSAALLVFVALIVGFCLGVAHSELRKPANQKPLDADMAIGGYTGNMEGLTFPTGQNPLPSEAQVLNDYASDTLTPTIIWSGDSETPEPPK